MWPVKLGSADEFWRLAAGVELGDTATHRRGQAFYPEYGWVAYTLSHMHGSDLFRVPESEAYEKLPAVRLLLLEASELGEDTPNVRGFHEWLSEDPRHQTPIALFYAILRAKHEHWEKNDGLSWVVADQEESSFWRRWHHLNLYWANFVFEWLLISGLALFLVWPGIKGMSVYRWAAHFGFAPLLFMVPAYLGYASFSYTSAGLSGGIVYPYLLHATAFGHCNRWDRWLLQHCPQILAPMSAPIGEWVSISGRGMPGPTSLIALGLLIMSAFIAISWAWRFFEAKQLVMREPNAKSSANTAE